MGVDTIENISTDPRLPEKSKQKFIEKHIRAENRRKIEHQLERLDYDDPRYELLKAELETTNHSGAAKTGTGPGGKAFNLKDMSDAQVKQLQQQISKKLSNVNQSGPEQPKKQNQKSSNKGRSSLPFPQKIYRTS